MNRRDWIEVCIEDIDIDVREAERELVPMLRTDIAPTAKTIKDWSSTLVSECREGISTVLPLSKSEFEFIERLNIRSGSRRSPVRVHGLE